MLLWCTSFVPINLKKNVKYEILATSPLQVPFTHSITPPMISPLNIHVGCDVRRLFVHRMSRPHLQDRQNQPIKRSRASMIGHKIIKVKWNRRRRKDASPFDHVVKFEKRGVRYAVVIIQSEQSEARMRQSVTISFTGQNGFSKPNLEITLNRPILID